MMAIDKGAFADFVILIYNMRNERDNVVPKGKHSAAYLILDRAKGHKPMLLARSGEACWVPLWQEAFKVNVDTTLHGDRDRVRLGVVVHDDDSFEHGVKWFDYLRQWDRAGLRH
ncbi:hypothetical protein PVK06_022847 [Gossypium arboreum]|uniref:C2 domain-containing protein n=1 Tax=Gossypium arboreum TaxID=29729 RepID=A0ABR0P9K9_GOSAR|nr:hypothetical protein PVK06_022847 [Gossypium arboreum]